MTKTSGTVQPAQTQPTAQPEGGASASAAASAVAVAPTVAPTEPTGPVAYDPNTDPNVNEMKNQIDIIGHSVGTDSPQYKELVKGLDEFVALQTSAANGQQPPAAAAAPAAVAAAGSPEASAEGAAAQAAADAVASKFFGHIQGKEDEKPIEFKSLPEFQQHLGKELGLPDVESPDFINQFLGKAKTWQKEASEKSLVQAQLDQMQQEFTQMPPAIFEGIQAWANNQDYKAAIQKNLSGLDLSKSFDNNDKQTVLNHYFPGQYKPEQVAEGGDLVNSAINLAKVQFDRDKESFQARKQDTLKSFEKNVMALRESANNSAQNLKSEYPSFDDTDVSQVKRLMETDDVMSLFKDQYGRFLPDAAKKIAFALNGESEIKTLSEALKKRTLVAKEIVDGGSTVMPRNASQQVAATPGGDQEFLKEAQKLYNQSPYAHNGGGGK